MPRKRFKSMIAEKAFSDGGKYTIKIILE